jgi:hypothetical protein
MAKTNNTKKKLNLHRETLQTLSTTALAEAAGGVILGGLSLRPGISAAWTNCNQCNQMGNGGAEGIMPNPGQIVIAPIQILGY